MAIIANGRVLQLFEKLTGISLAAHWQGDPETGGK